MGREWGMGGREGKGGKRTLTAMHFIANSWPLFNFASKIPSRNIASWPVRTMETSISDFRQEEDEEKGEKKGIEE
jgi:hypothetical protein